MNTQEAIEKIKNLEGLTILDKTINFDSEMIPKKEVFNIINQIDEPEKTVVPRFIFDVIESFNENEKFLYRHMDCQSKEIKEWLDHNERDFYAAWLAYPNIEIEKEKLYTAKVKIAAEFSYLNKRVERGDYFMSNKNESFRFKTHFPQSELEDLGLWNNPAFEIEEVEE